MEGDTRDVKIEGSNLRPDGEKIVEEKKKGESSKSGIFVWGRGGDGQLGVGDIEDEILPKEVLSLSGKTITKIACGGNHTLVVTDVGDVYSWGWNSSGQLGLGDTNDQLLPACVRTLTLAKAFQKHSFVQVAAGSEHSCALTSNGKVYIWGGNEDGQLGLGESLQTLLIPRLILNLHKFNIREVSCGASHTMALADNGAIFSWGRGANGRLGHGNETAVNEPKKIQSLKNIQVIRISCGWSHSMCIDSLGQVYTWGKGADGRLGHSDESDQLVPKLVDFFGEKKSFDISGGYYHSAVVIEDTLYTFGWNEFGQCGFPNSHNLTQVLYPRKVDALKGKKVVEISCGGFHTVCLTENGECYTFGRAENGQLGIGSKENQFEPCKVSKLEGKFICRAAAGWWHTVIFHSEEAAKEISEARITKINEAVKELENLLADLEEEDEKPKEGEQTSPKIERRLSKSASSEEVPPSPLRSRSSSFVNKIGDWLSSIRNKQQLLSESKKNELLERDWEEILPKWNDMRKSSKVKALRRQGIPVNKRGKVWKHAIGNRLEITKQLFEIFESHANDKKKQSETEKKVSKFIEVDIPRTWPGLQFFTNAGPFYTQLYTVLECFALFRPDIGYSQGMSYLAAMLLLNMDAFDAFVCFANLVNTHFFLSLFRLEINEILRHVKIFELLLTKELPEVYERFIQVGVSPEQYLIEWWMTIFSKSFPPTLAARIWDIFVFEGEVFLIRVSIGLLSLLKDNLLKAEDIEECVKAIRNAEWNKMDESKVIQAILEVNMPNYIRQFIQKIEQEPTLHQSIGVRETW